MLVLPLILACIPHFEDRSGDPDGSTATGFDVGEPLPPIALDDQFGGVTDLATYGGEVLVLDISTMWCGPCQELAATVQATQDEFEADGFEYVTVLQEDTENGPLEVEELVIWAEAFGIVTPPVLNDFAEVNEERVTWGAIHDGAFPAVLIIGRDGVVVERIDNATEIDIHDGIEAAL